MYGTAYYIAPEVLSGTYTEKCDLWSIGVILYIMLSGKPPFQGQNDKEILRKVADANYTLNGEIWQKRSDDAKQLIKQLMEKDVAKRLTAKDALNHPWITRKVPQQFDANLAKQTLDNLIDFRVRNNCNYSGLSEAEASCDHLHGEPSFNQTRTGRTSQNIQSIRYEWGWQDRTSRVHTVLQEGLSRNVGYRRGHQGNLVLSSGRCR
jgi:serine/threonine protein kinase